MSDRQIEVIVTSDDPLFGAISSNEPLIEVLNEMFPRGVMGLPELSSSTEGFEIVIVALQPIASVP